MRRKPEPRFARQFSRLPSGIPPPYDDARLERHKQNYDVDKDRHPLLHGLSVDANLAYTSNSLELEETLIPYGLHVAGKPASDNERTDLLAFASEALDGETPEQSTIARRRWCER
jgi:cobalamin biosynthesis Mg chelatase CobN